MKLTKEETEWLKSIIERELWSNETLGKLEDFNLAMGFIQSVPVEEIMKLDYSKLKEELLKRFENERLKETKLLESLKKKLQ